MNVCACVCVYIYAVDMPVYAGAGHLDVLNGCSDYYRC